VFPRLYFPPRYRVLVTCKCSYVGLFCSTDSLTWTWMVFWSCSQFICACAPFGHDVLHTVLNKRTFTIFRVECSMRWSTDTSFSFFQSLAISLATHRWLTLKLTSRRHQFPTPSTKILPSRRCKAVGQGIWWVLVVPDYLQVADMDVFRMWLRLLLKYYIFGSLCLPVLPV